MATLRAGSFCAELALCMWWHNDGLMAIRVLAKNWVFKPLMVLIFQENAWKRVHSVKELDIVVNFFLN
jgi:hypothetical protein